MQLFAKFKTILRRWFRATLNFQIFKVALNRQIVERGADWISGERVQRLFYFVKKFPLLKEIFAIREMNDPVMAIRGKAFHK